VIETARSIKIDELSPEAKANRKNVLEQQSAVTRQISDTARNLAFGLVASCYALLLANKDLTGLFVSAKEQLLIAAALGIAAIIFDAAQYVFGYINVRKALNRKDQLYPEDWSRAGRQTCFVMKQVLAYSGTLLLLGIIASRVM
jgi:hypothetical protein